MKTLIITTGDEKGIGLEVTAKALNHLVKKRVAFLPIVWISERQRTKFQLSLVSQLVQKWNCFEVSTLEEAVKLAPKLKKVTKPLIFVRSVLSPAEWVVSSSRACLNGQAAGLVTAPLSKTLIKKSGLKEVGHTEILKRVSGVTTLNMGFLGNKFSVLLATDHVSLQSVPKKLTAALIKSTLINAQEMAKLTNSKKPIAILGLNPHAGEQGLIGSEERRLKRVIDSVCSKISLKAEYFLVPDAAFLKKNWSRYACYVALYHDQGLIPFKMIHGQDSGVHITLGLPFVRTSVDHGTAFDIFDKNVANPSSMIDAINSAIKLTRRKS